MMPVSTLPRDAIYPLGPDDFIRRVLVPEAATLLIEEDMGITRPEALLVIKESREYGKLCFMLKKGIARIARRRWRQSQPFLHPDHNERSRRRLPRKTV